MELDQNSKRLLDIVDQPEAIGGNGNPFVFEMNELLENVKD